MNTALRLVLLLFSLATAAIAGAPHLAAQTPEPVDGAGATYTALPGFESGVMRIFTAGADTEPVAASPAAVPGLSSLTTVILAFDTDVNAQSAMTQLQADIQGESIATSVIVGDLGDKNAAFTLEDAEGTVTASVLVVQTGTEVIIVLAEGSGIDAADLTTDLAQSMVITMAGAAPPTFAPDGTSTGGEWDRLPNVDETGLPNAEDIDL